MNLPSPRRLFAVTAMAEMFTWAGLLIAMGLKYGGVTERVVPVAGGVHGFVFLCYLVVTVAVWIDGRWSVTRGLLGLGSTIVPFMTVPFERAQRRRGEPAPRWQVVDRAPGSGGPSNGSSSWCCVIRWSARWWRSPWSPSSSPCCSTPARPPSGAAEPRGPPGPARRLADRARFCLY